MQMLIKIYLLYSHIFFSREELKFYVLSYCLWCSVQLKNEEMRKLIEICFNGIISQRIDKIKIFKTN